MMKVCAECGEPTTSTYCDEHTPPRPSAHQRGYDTKHRKLSKQARKLAPFCEDCGTTKNLTLDHGPETWARREEGKTLRLRDYRGVICRACQNKRGAAR